MLSTRNGWKGNIFTLTAGYTRYNKDRDCEEKDDLHSKLVSMAIVMSRLGSSQSVVEFLRYHVVDTSTV
jgi:hypothetical protein